MSNASYFSAINHAAEISPGLDRPGDFIRWAEDICQLISHIYSVPYETVTEDLYNRAKDDQGYEDYEDE